MILIMQNLLLINQMNYKAISIFTDEPVISNNGFKLVNKHYSSDPLDYYLTLFIKNEDNSISEIPCFPTTLLKGSNLYDSNDIELFEEDVVQIKSEATDIFGGEDPIFIVKYKPGGFVFCNIHNESTVMPLVYSRSKHITFLYNNLYKNIK